MPECFLVILISGVHVGAPLSVALQLSPYFCTGYWNNDIILIYYVFVRTSRRSGLLAFTALATEQTRRRVKAAVNLFD